MKNQIENEKAVKLEGNIRKSISDFFVKAVEKKIFDAILMPMIVPSKDSYAWILIQDKEILKDAEPIAPIMPINAAKALKRYTRIGKGNLKIAALMRPCEIRAAIELSKLNQIKFNNITLFSFDCVGALPMQDFINDPDGKGKIFDDILENRKWDSAETKPICQICDNFSLPVSDLHFGLEEDSTLLIANSDHGKDIISRMKMKSELDLDNWKQKVEKIKSVKNRERKNTFETLKQTVECFDNIAETFSQCIGCHNCGSACPICYCRKCYFDSSVAKPNSDLKLMRANQRGAISLPLDKIMFHVGRMAHMSLSCVSCGLCSDACPVDIPVAKIFGYVGSQTQDTFDYQAGNNLGEALPMKEYKLDEIGKLGEMVKKAEVEENHND